MANKNTVSAQVIFRPASGEKLDRSAAITADNIAQFVPRPDSVKAATQLFSKHGFDVAPLVGNSFSITASKEVFEKVFGVRLHEPDGKSIMFVDDTGKPRLELQRSHLPKEVRDTVETISFTEPPDFGPTQFMM